MLKIIYVFKNLDNKKGLRQFMKFVISFLLILFTSKMSYSLEFTKSKVIASNSMLPTYSLGKSVDVKISLFGLNKEKLCRGCIVSYTSKDDDGKVIYNIHRIVGLENDNLIYKYSDDILLIGGNSVEKNFIGYFDVKSNLSGKSLQKFEEISDSKKYMIVIDNNHSIDGVFNYLIQNKTLEKYPYLAKDLCKSINDGFLCDVPKNHIFVMGDNRRNTLFGFVPIENIIGYIE